MRRQICPINVAWLRLQDGTLRVDLETCKVWSRTKHGWMLVRFVPTVKRHPHTGGYLTAKLRITIAGRRHRQHCCLHRIVWMAKHGQELWPSDQIDHGKAGKQCNHWSNLERVTQAENLRRRFESNQATAEAAADF